MKDLTISYGVDTMLSMKRIKKITGNTKDVDVTPLSFSKSAYVRKNDIITYALSYNSIFEMEISNVTMTKGINSIKALVEDVDDVSKISELTECHRSEYNNKSKRDKHKNKETDQNKVESQNKEKEKYTNRYEDNNYKDDKYKDSNDSRSKDPNTIMPKRINISLNKNVNVCGLDGKDIHRSLFRKMIKCNDIRCNVKVRALSKDGENKRSLMFEAYDIDIISVGKDYAKENGLPSYDIFFNSCEKEEIKSLFFQESFLHESQNNAIKYVLFEQNDKYYIVESYQYQMKSICGMIPHAKSIAMWEKDIEDNEKVTIYAADYTNNNLFHYKVTMSYSSLKYDTRHKEESYDFRKELYTRCKRFVQERCGGIRGIWYDVGNRRKRSHINLHMVSSLSPKYLRCVLADWEDDVGSIWIERMFNPSTWRIYASRNHNILFGDQKSYRSANDVFSKLIRFQHAIQKNSNSEWNTMDTSDVNTISEYRLY